MAVSSNFSPSAEIVQCLRRSFGGICELAKTPLSPRRFYALAVFLYGDIRQPDHIENTLLARPDVHFHFDHVGVNAKDRSAESLEEPVEREDAPEPENLS